MLEKKDVIEAIESFFDRKSNEYMGAPQKSSMIVRSLISEGITIGEERFSIIDTERKKGSGEKMIAYYFPAPYSRQSKARACIDIFSQSTEDIKSKRIRICVCTCDL